MAKMPHMRCHRPLLWLVQWLWQWALRRELHRWFWRTSTDQSIVIISLCLCTTTAVDLELICKLLRGKGEAYSWPYLGLT